MSDRPREELPPAPEAPPPADEAPEPAAPVDDAPKPPGDTTPPADEAPEPPTEASGPADEAPEPTAPTEVPEPAAPEATTEAAPEPAEGTKPPTDASSDEAPEPTAPTDAPEPLTPEPAPEQAEATEPPTDAPPSADEAPEPTAPTDAPEPAETPKPPGDAPRSADEAPEPTAPIDAPEPTAAEAQDPAAPTENEADAAEGPGGAEQYDNSALRDGPSYHEEIDDQLAARGLDRSEHDKLRLTRTNDLTEPQAREVVGVRDGIKLDDGRMVTKVLKPEVAQAYLDNDTTLGGRDFDPGEFRGSIARGSDTADLRSMDELRDGLALDDGGAGWTPVPPGASEAYQLRFPSPHGMRADATLGAVGDQGLADHVAGMAGQSPGRAWDDPFLGTGYTGGGVPEWEAKPTAFPDHAEIWRMHADGTEEAVGFFDKNEGLWNYYD
ncbi:hypothetical protein [Streptomyces sp. RerS4]|uniref:hypothetical protein n=1 Tax=Streptomyces sp. RerS4 TaxID=2942449 RepID=UPI00201BAD87|nr:hypothetical protein [Streptomyces sp. RerS4]UQX04548.1 hypothetical protein M4D82_31570 [Streptomyces sp. RerS4]